MKGRTLSSPISPKGLIRRITGLMLIPAVLLSLGSSATASAPDTALPFVLRQVGPGVYAAIDSPSGKSGSNAGFVIGDDGVLVIDSFFNPDAARALVSEIRKLTPKPIRYVVNTHYHVDHVGGDNVLRDAGAIIIAHRNERAWVRTDNLHLFGDRLTPERKAMVETLALPDVTTTRGLTIWLGSREILIRPALGHTGGDLMVSVPDAKVLFCGDILWRHVSPNIIDGNVAEWIKTTEGLTNAEDAAETAFVPGHGNVAAVKDVTEFAAYLRDLRALVQAERASGITGDALIKAALPKFSKQHGDWGAFSYFAPLELGFMDQELAGTKRVPAPVADD